MLKDQKPSPFYIDDTNQLREKLARAEADGTLMGRVWQSVRRRARARPADFPWFTPFVALVTGEERDLEPARQSIREYVATFDRLGFTASLHFHFWCHAFPHARWALYFQWLDALGAWEPDEARRLREQLITFQFVNFFSGLRTKPEPDTADNQTMSLALSNGLVGHLFRLPPNGSAIAERMFHDGARRLPQIIGGMPECGYSGEGSTYQDYVVGPSIPYIVEFLERAVGGDWFTRKLPRTGCSAEAITRMIGREWMPGGLLLPWDHYGYSLPCRSTVSYAARRTGDPWFIELLEHHAGWSHDINVGWGNDDLVWSLVWWPETRARLTGKVFPSWAAPDIGAAIVSENADLYLMQMWDESTPVYPLRAQVNPNALVLSAFGSPLTTDGVPSRECTAFNFDDTWREVGYMAMKRHKFNFGSGCGGAHSVIIVDGWEGMRVNSPGKQAELLEFDEKAQCVAADVTPIYRERWPDARRVARRSRLCGDRFWLIEDLAAFDAEHDVASRWYLRPSLKSTGRGVSIETAEGVRLQMIPLAGPDAKTWRTVAGYPDRLDGESVAVDFRQRGRECRWLWLAWPDQTREVLADVADGWQAIPDPQESLDLGSARAVLHASGIRLPFTVPAFLIADVPVTRRWWYSRMVAPPAGKPWWLRLPRQLGDARLWVNGTEIDMRPHYLRMQLLAPQVQMPILDAREVEVCVCCTACASQYERKGDIAQSFEGRPAIMVSRTAPAIEEAAWRDGEVIVRTSEHTWKIPHRMLSV